MSILIKPVITEKSNLKSEMDNQYTFLVEKTANKVEIKNAVALAYGVSVLKVRTMNYGPERKIKNTKHGIQNGKTNSFKKAIVHVEGTIDFYANI